MSRWVIEFHGHHFWSMWLSLKDAVQALIVDDHTVTSAVEELARLKKVTEYISGILDGMDPELTPKSVWDQFSPQLDICRTEVSNYTTSRNVAHLVNANSAADNLLTYIRPYMVLPDQAITAAKNAAVSVTVSIENRIARFEELADQKLAAVRNLIDEAQSNTEKIEEITSRAKDFEQDIFGPPGDNEESIKWKIENFKKLADEQSSAISDLHNKLVKQREADGSLEDSFIQGLNRVTELADQAQEAHEKISKELQELERYHSLVFGTTEEEQDKANKPTLGLKGEINARIEQAKGMLLEHDTKYKALFAKIESLLPGATSAGLASAYGDMRKSFDDRVTLYSRLFYGALFLLFISGIISTIHRFSIWPFGYDLVETPDWQGMLKLVLYKVPLFLPGIWLAIFSATRRNQYERLQQEYAHKETLAMSYESYRKQIDTLGQGSEGLRAKLIERAIDAIAFNASETLDKPHKERSPIEILVDKIKTDELAKLLELVKSKKD